VHDALRDRARIRAGRHPQPTAAVIDSASVRGADTVPARSRGYDAGKRINGRKRHIAVDTGGLLLAVVVTIAGIQDRDGAVRLRAVLRAKFSTIVLIWADGGYAGRLVRWAQTVLALTISFVERTDDLTGFQVIPAAGSWNAPWPGSASTAAASVTTRPGPSTPRRWSTSP
jgi:hypothetical protein